MLAKENGVQAHGLASHETHELIINKVLQDTEALHTLTEKDDSKRKMSEKQVIAKAPKT